MLTCFVPRIVPNALNYYWHKGRHRAMGKVQVRWLCLQMNNWISSQLITHLAPHCPGCAVCHCHVTIGCKKVGIDVFCIIRNIYITTSPWYQPCAHKYCRKIFCGNISPLDSRQEDTIGGFICWFNELLDDRKPFILILQT